MACSLLKVKHFFLVYNVQWIKDPFAIIQYIAVLGTWLSLVMQFIIIRNHTHVLH